MKNQVSFEGFDFAEVWEMRAGDYSYPVFQAKYE
jgi:hypothetical protein